MAEQKIIPHLWFDGAAEEAAALYTSLVPGSAISAVSRYGKAGFEVHGQPEGTAMNVDLCLGGQRLLALNGGARFRPTPAVSYFLTFEDRATLDAAWTALGEGGQLRMPLDEYPWSPRYGWVDDRWGMSWQFALGDPALTGGQVLTPMLLFVGAQAGHAEAAMAHYTELFPDAGIGGVLRHDGTGDDPAGTVMHAQFRLAGQTFMAGDSALMHDFTFTEANSFVVFCDDQAEIDHYWQALSAKPEAERCGWLKDRFGLSWQIIPRHLPTLLSSSDPKVMETFMGMGMIDIAALERAAE
ncbi:VOC family protein [Rhodobacteraceae bacterium 2376]|uniref:VOC family protein n=1 Tax=Rhabdonatronobacter sediminivivens TaxID=2743469 RepID=A0A7Z0I2G7_9RHOB|nr:VOC family protein [Rhabdonatronobacter sediminivivens]NYS26372.1 VOC family protein [Rhabdonatronobacter sediminivivens]